MTVMRNQPQTFEVVLSLKSVDIPDTENVRLESGFPHEILYHTCVSMFQLWFYLH